MPEFEVIFEDSHIMVINKPAGLVVNRSETSPEGTLQEQISDVVGIEDDEADVSESEFRQRGGIVHRLDKDTSGVMVAAKDENSFINLQKQFKDREVEKVYLALALGKIEEELFEVNAPIKRNPKERFKYAVVKDGKPAVTDFRKLKELVVSEETLTLLEVKPKTGRTHQIRVHLAALGHPVAGDEIYGTRVQEEKWRGVYGRMMLHALSLSFRHPFSGDKMTFEAKIPSEFSM